MTETRSAALPACSDGFDDVDGGPECGVYIQMRGVEQVRVRREFERRDAPRRVAFVGRVASIQHGLRHAAVDQPGVEVPQAVMRGEPLAERPLPRGRRPVDGDDHERSAPRARIRGGKPGKLVAMIAASSTRTGFSLESPMTKNAMAMR